MKKLYIDTSDRAIIEIKVIINEKEFVERVEEAINIEKALVQAGISIHEIDKIYVKRKGTSFTGLRVGISIANTLSFSLQKNVNDKNLGFFETPDYE